MNIYLCIKKEKSYDDKGGNRRDSVVLRREKISYKQRLEELGINTWAFYDAKRRYAPKHEGDNAGEFLQLIPGGSFLPNPIKPSRSRSAKQKTAEQNVVSVSIELRTPTGTMMRINGNLTSRELKDIIIASSAHV